MVRSIKRRKTIVIDEEAPAITKKGKRDSGKPVERQFSFFEKILLDSGFILPENNKQPNELSTDQVQFQKKLTISLKTHASYPQVLEDFNTGLQEYWQDLYRFCQMLLPTVTSKDCEVSSRGKQQDSLLRLLLGIDILQPSIVTCLLEKLPEVCLHDDVAEVSLAMGGIDIPHHIISQFRWLERIQDSAALTSKIFEVISISEEHVQKELITCLPDLIEDNKHAEVATQLRELLLENSKLTSVVLDALSNLNLNADVLSDIRRSVVQILDSASMEDLPVVIKFIHQCVQERDAFEVVCDVRSKLDFSATIPPDESSTPLHSQRDQQCSEKTHEMMVLEAIRSGLRFQKDVADGWMKSIESINVGSDHKVFDLFVLLILHTIAARKKNVESLFRSKIKSNLFAVELLNAAFHSHPQILFDNFETILRLAESFLRSPELSVSEYGCNMYKMVFISFDTFCQQEVVGALVTHIGSGYPMETEASFQILSELVCEHATLMKPFTVFIKGILDYLGKLSLAHTRCLFTMLSTLAYAGYHDDDDVIEDEMHIVIRKQLASHDDKYKRIGIIGAVMIVGCMARRHPDQESEEPPDTDAATNALSTNAYKQVVSLLELVKMSVRKAFDAAALFYDELATVVLEGRLDKRILHWITESVVADFQEAFLVDVETIKSKSDPQLQLSYDLDDAEEGGICVNIFSALLAEGNSGDGAGSSKGHVKRSSRLVCLAPHFRLLRVCEQRKSCGNLDEIDALLGCPIIMFNENVLERFNTLDGSDKDIIILSIIHTINWIRELMNAFSSQDDAETRGKMLARIATMTTLNTTLERLLTIWPACEIPIAHFDLEDSWMEAIKKQLSSLKEKDNFKKPKKVKSTKRKQPTDETTNENNDLDEQNASDKELDDDQESTTSDKSDDKDKGKEKTVNLKTLQASLRELDMNVFKAFTYESVSKALVDSEQNTKASEVLQLQTEHILFLLEELQRKLEHSVSSTSTTRRCFLRQSVTKQIGFTRLSRLSGEAIVRSVVSILPNLLVTLEATMTYFEDVAGDNDGIVDCAERIGEDSRVHSRCYYSLLTCLRILLTWHGILSPKNIDILKSILSGMVARVSSVTATTKLPELVRGSFRYMSRFSTTVPSVDSATSLLDILSTLADRADNPALLRKEIVEISETFLKTSWRTETGEQEKGTKYNDSLLHILKVSIDSSPSPLEAIDGWCRLPMEQLASLEGKADQAIELYPTLSRCTFIAFYRGLFDCTISYSKLLYVQSSKSSDGDEAVEEKMTKLQSSMTIFQILIGLVKAFDTRQVFNAALKNSKLFLEMFLKYGMPLLDRTLRTHKVLVHSILKSLQHSTRSLQHICGHSKVLKDNSLTTYVPALKKCLEAFVFRVKAMLAVNNCDSAFWLGNLKNRDMQGNEILSQMTRGDEDDEDGDDNEDLDSLAADEESEDEEEDGEKEENQDDPPEADDYESMEF